MYYSDITNPELQYFHNRPVHNFTLTLSQALTSPLFKVEEIITDSIYKLYPLFYTGEITSSNSNDNILDNKVIICTKEEKETYLTFISDSNNEIVDYSEYGNYYAIGDSLTTAEFNAFVSLLRQNIKHNDEIRISDTVTGLYGNYEFDIDNTTVLDSGIVVTDETITAQPKVKLSNAVFGSKYILQLSILYYTGVNILDDETEDYKVVDTLEITLENDEWVDIPVETLEQGYIIDLDANVLIDHTVPVIQDYPQHLYLTGDKTIIQSGDTLDLFATVKDSIKGLTGQTVYFYEEYEPFKINLTGDKSIMQTGETLDLTAKLHDEDGSLIEDEEIYFYEATDLAPPVPTDLTLTVDNTILSYYDEDTATLTAILKDQYDKGMSGQSIVFKQGDTVLATKTTNSEGVATYTYNSQGVGDVTFTAEMGRFVSEIYVEDCINYDPLTSASGKWTIPSGVTSNYSSDGWRISANAYKQIKLTEKLTSDCSVEFTLIDYSTPSGNNPSVIIYQYTDGETTPNQHIMTNNYASTLTVLENTLSRSLVKGAVYKIEYTASTMKVYENDTLLASARNTVGFPTRFEWHMGVNGRYAVYNDLKIKPL